MVAPLLLCSDPVLPRSCPRKAVAQALQRLENLANIDFHTRRVDISGMVFNTLHKLCTIATGLYWNFTGIKLILHNRQYGSLLVLLFFCNMRSKDYLCHILEYDQSWQNHSLTPDSSCSVTSKDIGCTIPLLFSHINNQSSLKVYHRELFSCHLIISLICIQYFAPWTLTFPHVDDSPMTSIHPFC